jgi:hypothetical protein
VWGTPPFTRLSPLATTQTSPANAVIAPPEWRAAGSTARARDERYPLSKTAQGRALVVLEPYAYAQSQMDESSSREPALASKEWLAMGASSFVSVLACSFLVGCGSIVQPGLANAPGLGGASPETRVHDAVANGHNACERSMFPQAEVLRGRIPPCGRESHAKTYFVPRLRTAELGLSSSYPLGLCPAPRSPRSLGTEKGMVAFPLSAPRWWLACDLPSDKVHSQ